MRYSNTVEHHKMTNRRISRNAIKLRIKKKKSFGFKKSEVAYDKEIGLSKNESN